MPSEVQKALSRGKELFGESHQGTDHYPKGSRGHYKPTLVALQHYQGGVIKAKIVAPPEDQEVQGEGVEEDDFEDAQQNQDQQQENQNQQEDQANEAERQQEVHLEEPEGAQGNNNMANNGGGQLSAIPVYTGNRGLDAITYADAIDGSIPQFWWTQAQAAQAVATRGGAAVST